jgi:hypothetical protein
MEVQLFSNEMIEKLRQKYSTIKTIDPCGENYQKLCEQLDQMESKLLVQLRDANIAFLSSLARNRCVRRKIYD